MKYNAYLIPGFAADERMFRNFILDDCDITCLNWDYFDGAKSYAEYAKEILLPKIKMDKPIVLVGFSMGGMVAAELAKLINPDKLIFISSAKNKYELPKGKVNFLRIIKPHKFINQQKISRATKALSPMLNFTSKEHRDLFLSMVNGLPEGTIEFGLKSFLNWKNKVMPQQEFLHIHGADDKLIPIKRIKDHVEVPGGHYLLRSRTSRMVTKMVNDYIKK